MEKEGSNWDAKHKLHNGVPAHLFDDHDPATTIKGTGFKDAETARRTIRLSGQPGCLYKQYWTIRAMLERARHHPAQTQGMRDAAAIFEGWMKNRPLGVKASEEELAQRRLLAESAANAHCRSRCKDDAECKMLALQDRRDCIHRLRDASKRTARFLFPLASTSFVSVFGGPGEHGYGMHVCDDAQRANLRPFRCSCAYTAVHTVSVHQLALPLLNLGSTFPLKTFVLKYDGGTQQAHFVLPNYETQTGRDQGCGSRGTAHQPTLHRFFKQGGVLGGTENGPMTAAGQLRVNQLETCGGHALVGGQPAAGGARVNGVEASGSDEYDEYHELEDKPCEEEAGDAGVEAHKIEEYRKRDNGDFVCEKSVLFQGAEGVVSKSNYTSRDATTGKRRPSDSGPEQGKKKILSLGPPAED